MSQEVFSTLMTHYGKKAAAEEACEMRDRRRRFLVSENVRRKGILAGLLLTALCAFIFREDIGELMPLPGHVKKAKREDRMKQQMKEFKKEAMDRKDALETIFK